MSETTRVAYERCSEISLRAGESLVATAPFVERWLLVEVPPPWPRDVSEAGPIPEESRRAIGDWLERTPRSKLLYLRRPGRSGDATAVFVVRCQEHVGETRGLELERLEDLARLEIDEAGEPTDAPLVLVCGHGSRDNCCALRGTAVFSALAPSLGDEQLWISSHHGGHRFAANVLLPQSGVHLGRVDPGNATRLTERALEGRLDLDHYRGRTCYEPLVQAAEHALRRETALDGVGDLLLRGVQGDVVSFRDSGGDEHAVAVEATPGVTVPASCGTAPAPQPSFAARVL